MHRTFVRPALTVAFALSTSATLAPAAASSPNEPFDECCLLIENPHCGQSLQRADGSRVAFEGWIDQPEFSSVRVTGTLSAFACTDGCSSAMLRCLEVETVVLCEQGTAYCFAEGAPVPCPCANELGTGRGCLNSSNVGGRFRTGGDPEVGRFVDLYLDGLPPGAPCVLFTGTNCTPTPFSEGLLCLAPPYRRLAALQAGPDGTLETAAVLSVLTESAPGDTVDYQVWYHDAGVTYCSTSTNFTNAVSLEWLWAPPQ